MVHSRLRIVPVVLSKFQELDAVLIVLNNVLLKPSDNEFSLLLIRLYLLTYLDILVKLQWLSECQLLLNVKKIVYGIIVDLEVRAPDNKDTFLLTLGVFHSLEEFLQGKYEDSICVEVLGSEVRLLAGCGGGLQTLEVLQGGVQVGFQGVRIQNTASLVVAPFGLSLEHGWQGRHHRGRIDSRSYCHGLSRDRQLTRD